MKAHISKFIKLAVTASLIIFAACQQEKTDTIDADNISVPPSLAQTEMEEKETLINLTDKQVTELNIKTSLIENKKLSYKISIPGVALPAPDRISLVSAPITGRIVKVYAHEGETIKKGDLLLEMESLPFAELVADYLTAVAEEEYAAIQYDRLETLVEKKISSQQALEKSSAEFSRAQVGVKAALARLRAVGVKKEQITQWLKGEGSDAILKVYAPISGVLTEHLIDLGQAVEGNEHLLTIIDLSEVLIRGYAAPEDGHLLKANDPVKISLKDYPTQQILAKVKTINPALDPINKAISVHALVPSQGSWPRPGQNVRMQVQVTTPAEVIAVPLQAIEWEGDKATAFVQVAENQYRRQSMEIKRIVDQYAIIRSGLSAGEHVAISNVFTLKALGKYEEFAE